MKSTNLILSLAAVFALAASAFSHDGHDHAAAKIKAPHGGRVMTAMEPHAEFFLTPERKVQITFLDDQGGIVAPAGQQVTVITGERLSPVKLSFKPSGRGLLSEEAIPVGNGFPTVVQIRTTPDAKTATEKFYLDLAVCSSCGLSEYACTCGH